MVLLIQAAMGTEVRWEEMPVGFVVDTENAEALDADGIVWAVVSAAAAWNAVEGAAIDMHFDGVVPIEGAGDANTVTFVEDWPHDPVELAHTSTWWLDSGEMIAFDLEINTRDHDWSLDGDPELADLQNTVTHELGHALGFGHVSDPEATMYASASAGETNKRDLAPADVEAAVATYAVAEETDYTVAYCGTGGAPPLLGLVLGLLVRRRR